MIGYWHCMKIWTKSTNISGLSDIKKYNKTKTHSFSQFKPFSKFVYFLGALSFTSAVNKWNRDCQNVQRSLLLHGIRTLCTYASWDIRLCTYHRKKCIQKVFPSPIKKGKKGQTRPPREAFISATSKSFSQLYLGYCPNVSLLNNAPNYLVGCVIQKR